MVMDEKQALCLEAIEKVAAGLLSARKACEQCQTDAVRLACMAGSKDLQTILEYIDKELCAEDIDGKIVIGGIMDLLINDA